MKFSFLLTVAALFVVVAASLAPADDHDEVSPLIFEEIKPFYSHNDKRQDSRTDELVEAAGLIFNAIAPLSDENSGSFSLEKREATCPVNYGFCPGSQSKCCPLGGDCCKKGCCASGSWCYSTGCCRRDQFGCENNSCCPKNSRCCKGGGCCAKGYNCWITSTGQRGCCPVGKVCNSPPCDATGKAGKGCASCTANQNLGEIANTFISRCRKATIRQVFPGQHYDQTLGFLKGCREKSCKTAWKLLNDKRFEKN